MAGSKPDRLHFTPDDKANALIARDPFALLVGFALDQQVSVPKAFSGPLALRERVGTIDPRKLAKLDLEEAFRTKPAIHRFPGAMAQRVQELAQVVVDEYGGDAERIWREAADGTELRRRLSSLPGFGEMKVRSLGSVLAKQFGVRAADNLVPKHQTLGDVDSPEAFGRYEAAKRAYKAKLKAQRAPE
jgi:uncharacterized HhH-GPD family protein